MILRSEQVRDYSAIATLHYRAFSNWKPDKLHVHESEMVALARQSKAFDPALSIVAQDGDVIVGHVLLMPAQFMVLGQVVSGVLLGPIGVAPLNQKTGIGSMLIEEGHRVAESMGYAFSLLCGHPAYYPRFGYIQNTFSVAGTKITVDADGDVADNTMSIRPVGLDDIPSIYRWQREMCKDDTLSILYAPDIMEYHANDLTIFHAMVQSGDETIGYVRRYNDINKGIKNIFCEPSNMHRMVRFLWNAPSIYGGIHVEQPIEQFMMLRDDPGIRVEDQRRVGTFAMICPLSPESIIQTYCDQVMRRQIQPGVISYPPYCDMDV